MSLSRLGMASTDLEADSEADATIVAVSNNCAILNDMLPVACKKSNNDTMYNGNQKV